MLLFALFACTEPATLEEKNIGAAPGPQGHCETEQIVLEGDELAAAEAAIADASGPRTESLSYDASGETTTLHLEAVATGAAALFQGTWVPDDPDSTETQECGSYVAVDTTLIFMTTDGAFDEEIDVEMHIEEFGGRIDHQVGFDGLDGDWDPDELDPDAWDVVDVDFAINLSAGASSGEVALYAERVTDDSDVSEAFDAARWGF